MEISKEQYEKILVSMMTCAVKEKLIPNHCSTETYLKNWDSMSKILNVVLEKTEVKVS